MRAWPRLTAVALASMSATAGATDWMQFGYEPGHSGNNTAETAITAANVATLTKLYEANLPGTVDSAPVLLTGVTVTHPMPMNSAAVKDLVFVNTTGGTLVALDAATGVEQWHATTSGKSPTTSTPAIDPGRHFIYSYGIDGFAHKYAVEDGTEQGSPWPQLITKKPDVEKGAGGFTIATVTGGATYLYVVTNGYGGDGGDYQGHIVTINLATGVQSVFNGQCSNLQAHLEEDQSAGALGVTDCPQVFSPFPGSSGIWGRPGAVYDASLNRLFFATANGLFDARDTVFRTPFEPMSSGFNFGDSVLALAADGTPAGQMPIDSYTPSNYAQLQSSDADLGSASPALLPAPAASQFQHLAVQGGKDAKLRLINLADLSGHHAPGFVSCSPSGPNCITSEVQILSVPQGGEVKPQPAVWVNTQGDGATWSFVATGNGLSGLKMSVNGGGIPSLSSQWASNITGNTTSPAIANGIVFAENGTHVIAVDPTTGTKLWTSTDSLGSFHWQALIVVNGRVFAPDNSGHLWAFGLP